MPTVLSDITFNSQKPASTEPHVGLEIEVENVEGRIEDLEETDWFTVMDGSLRYGGLEFLSNGPWDWEKLERNVLKFYEWQEYYGFSNGVRCSTHVHYNMLDRQEHEIAAVLTAYALVEPLLYRYCGPLREENIYCVPWYRAPDEVERAADIFNGRFSQLHNACKYSGLYLEPLIRFGTLEFRQAPVFETAGVLLTWCDMIRCLCEISWSHPEEVLAAFARHTPDEFVELIFGPQLTSVLFGCCETSFEELMEEYDVEAIAESISRCTYNVNGNMWFTPSFEFEGTGTEGYHRTGRSLHLRIGRHPDWDEVTLDYLREPPEMDEYYDDEQEDY